MPGPPAVKVAARHKAGLEAWLAETLSSKGVHDARGLARQIVILMDGAFSSMLVHRDPGYFEAAGRAAASLVGSQLPSALPR